MRILCSAVVEDPRKRDNLCECIEIIGGDSSVMGNKVYADYKGDEETAKKLMALFSQYHIHGISIIG